MISNKKKIEIIRARCEEQIEHYRKCKESSKIYLNYLQKYGQEKDILIEENYLHSIISQLNVYYEILFILDDIITF